MRERINYFKFKRATLVVALFFSINASGVDSPKQAVKETYRDIIDKAYNLSLQKDRSQAISLILGALKRETKKSGPQKELIQALDQVSKVFMGDKAQQQYELALSLKFSEPNLALTKLIEASRLEPENASIEAAIAQQQMMLGDCDGASARIGKNKDLSVYLEDWKLLTAQSALCENKFENYISSKTGADLKGPLAVYWSTLEVEYLYRSGQLAKGKEFLGNLSKLDPQFPETFYWNWKIMTALKQKSDRDAQKYLNTCKTLNSRQQRAYSAEPFLCRRTTEVETFLKNNNNAEL